MPFSAGGKRVDAGLIFTFHGIPMRDLFFTLLFIITLSSCATVKYDSAPTDYGTELARLQRQLLIRPNDPTLLRDLGILYFQAKKYDVARPPLYRSYELKADDPRTIFYYGMTLEYLGESEAALRVYINYTDVSSFSPYRKLIEGRYRILTREIVQRQFQALLRDEQKLKTERIVPKAVAVFPLAYQGTDPKYNALGKGLSEMMLIDLGQVKSLTMIERIRIEALLGELQFGQSSKVDPATAPRLGKLLGAGKIVSGVFNVSNNNLRMDVAAWDVVNKKFPDLKSKSDDLDNLFKIEKEIVFGVIKELGITLTPQEREKVQFIPTKNILAFINYCLGLQNEDARDFQSAKVYYNQAVTIDPNFGLAKTKLAAAEALNIGGGSKEEALSVAEQIDPSAKKKKDRINLVIDRLNNLEGGIGIPFKQGQDDRKAAQEPADGVLLPGPPAPPRR